MSTRRVSPLCRPRRSARDRLAGVAGCALIYRPGLVIRCGRTATHCVRTGAIRSEPPNGTAGSNVASFNEGLFLHTHLRLAAHRPLLAGGCGCCARGGRQSHRANRPGVCARSAVSAAGAYAGEFRAFQLTLHGAPSNERTRPWGCEAALLFAPTPRRTAAPWRSCLTLSAAVRADATAHRRRGGQRAERAGRRVPRSGRAQGPRP